MVLNLETFDRLVFHDFTGSILLRCSNRHSDIRVRAAEPSKAERAEPCGIKQMMSFHAKLKPKGNLSEKKVKMLCHLVLFFSDYMIIVGL